MKCTSLLWLYCLRLLNWKIWVNIRDRIIIACSDCWPGWLESLQVCTRKYALTVKQNIKPENEQERQQWMECATPINRTNTYVWHWVLELLTGKSVADDCTMINVFVLFLFFEQSMLFTLVLYFKFPAQDIVNKWILTSCQLHFRTTKHRNKCCKSKFWWKRFHLP